MDQPKISFLQRIKNRRELRRLQDEQDRLNGVRRQSSSSFMIFATLLLGVGFFLICSWDEKHITMPVVGTVTGSIIHDESEVSGPRRDPDYETVLGVDYTAGGRAYSYEFYGHFYQRKDAEQFLLEHPVKSQVQIYCDPDNPTQVSFGKPTPTFKWLLVGFCVFIVALVKLIF